MLSVGNLPLIKVVDVASLFKGEHQNIWRNIKRICQFINYIQADITLTVFDLADIGAFNPCFEGKLFLRPTTIVAHLSNSSAKHFNEPHARKIMRWQLPLYPLSGTNVFTLHLGGNSVPQKGQGANLTHWLNDGIWRTRKLKLATAAVLVMASATGARADDASALSGFYANSGNECIQATGVLYMCTADHCVSQDYRYGTTLYPTPAKAQVSIAPTSQVDGNGFQLQAGDVTLEYERDGGRSIRIVRPSGASLLTTYSARADASGKSTYSFIKEGVSVDPSVKPRT
ncbi:MAG: hypothetical protein JWP26_882 [Devosia sp.]|nr:hypothetical protein [Devosia sp.]